MISKINFITILFVFFAVIKCSTQMEKALWEGPGLLELMSYPHGGRVV